METKEKVAREKAPNFFEDFYNVQNDLEAVNKTAKGYDYKYADLPSLWEAIREVIAKNNFIVYGFTDNESIHIVAEHKSGRKIESRLPLILRKDIVKKTEITKDVLASPQDLGAEITYFRRYQIMTVFNVMTEDEDAVSWQPKQEKTIHIPKEESPSTCSVCGKDTIKAKTTAGEIFWSCPDWKGHKERGERWLAISKHPEPNKQDWQFEDKPF